MHGEARPPGARPRRPPEIPPEVPRSQLPEGRATDHWLRAVEARDFRNLPHLTLDLPPEGIVIVGDNGQGKTNLLEAIAYLHLLRSVRTARDQDVVRFGSSGFTVRGQVTQRARDRADRADRTPAETVDRHETQQAPHQATHQATQQATQQRHQATHQADRHTGHTVVVGFERATRRKRVTIDGAVPERLSDALGAVPSVTFSPVDVELVRGGPVGRRRYLDVVLATTSRRYLAALQSYRGALVRRNAALRTLSRRPSASASTVAGALEPWEPLLADAGAVLWSERVAWAERWAPELGRICTAIGERDDVHMRYLARHPDGGAGLESGSTGDLRGALAAALEAGRVSDLRHGATRTGPHRDDLGLTIGAHELRTFGSAGQQRTAAIALRILEAATLRGQEGAAPLLLFDDPFAELDERRSLAILEVLGGVDGWPGAQGTTVGQVILAVPRAADIPPGLTRLTRVEIVDGQLTGVAR